jgi:hypothetical protein
MARLQSHAFLDVPSNMFISAPSLSRSLRDSWQELSKMVLFMQL